MTRFLTRTALTAIARDTVALTKIAAADGEGTHDQATATEQVNRAAG